MEKKKIKVMTLIPNMGDGGAQKIVLNYLRDFKNDKDIDFKVFTYKLDSNSYYNRIINKEKLNVEYIEVPRTKINIPYIKKLFVHRNARKTWTDVIRKFNPDIVHIHLSLFLVDTMIPIINNKIPIRFDTLHSNPLRFNGRCLKRIQRAFQKESFVPICITKEQALIAKKHYGFDKYEIVYNGIDIVEIKSKIVNRNDARKKYNLSNDTFVILGVGRLDKIKRFDILIEVFAEVHEIRKDSVLLLAGEGIERKNLQELAKKMKIADSVIFLGYESNTTTLYCASDVFVMTSDSEASPLVLLEAQTCGLRSVISAGVPDESIITNKVKKMSKDASITDWCNALLDTDHVGEKVKDIKDYEIHNASENMKNLYLKYWKKYQNSKEEK